MCKRHPRNAPAVLFLHGRAHRSKAEKLQLLNDRNHPHDKSINRQSLFFMKLVAACAQDDTVPFGTASTAFVRSLILRHWSWSIAALI